MSKEVVSIVPQYIDKDSNPVVIKNGAVHDIFNARITDFKSESSGIIPPVLGNELLPIANISGLTGETQCIGTYNNLKDNSVLYFIWDFEDNHKIMQYKDGAITTVLKGSALNFQTDSPVISVDFYDKYLVWTDNFNPPRSIDIEKGNRTGKQVKATVYFGQPDPDNGVVIFENGQEYYFDAFDIAGNPLFATQTVLTADGTYEDDILTGANLYADAFNANTDINPYFTASVCACGKVEITEILPSGTDLYEITTMEVSEGGIGSPAPTLLVYDNIYPDDITEFHLAVPKWTPKCNPTAVYKYDSTYENNFVNDKVFQFGVRYVYKENIKSCLSPVSPIAVPNLNCHGSGGNYIEIDFSADMLTDPLFLNEIDKVELFVREHNEGQWGMITSLDLCEFGITRQFYNFYNDKSLIGVSQAEIVKPYESVPFICKGLALASEADAEGTRLFIGNGIEGYDKVCGDFSVVKDSFTPDGCPYTYDVTGRIETWSVFPNSNDYKRCVVWWDGTNIVFGGIASTVVSNIATDYEQVLPAKGFTVYLAGTNYFAITKQRFDGGLYYSDELTYYDMDYGILDGSDGGKLNAIRNLLQSGAVVTQEFTIKNVKHGQYIARVASHWCTLDGTYKGSPYRIDDSLQYQRTSTYIVGTATDTVTPAYSDPITITYKELRVEVPYNTVSSDVVIISDSFTLVDLTDASIVQATVVADGYIYTRSIYDPNVGVTDMENNFPCPYLNAVAAFDPFFVARVFAASDHNGFWFVSRSNADLSARTVEFPTLSINPILFATGDLSDFGDNAMITEKPIPAPLGSIADHYIYVEQFPQTQTQKQFLVSDGSSGFFKNVRITLNMIAPYGFTNDDGELNLVVPTRDIFGDAYIDDDFAYYSLGVVV